MKLFLYFVYRAVLILFLLSISWELAHAQDSMDTSFTLMRSRLVEREVAFLQEDVPILKKRGMLSGATFVAQADNKKSGYDNKAGSALIQASGTKEGRLSANQLGRRQDDKRPEDQWTIKFLGRPITIGGEYGITTKHLKDVKLEDSAKDDRSRVNQELQLEFLYDLYYKTKLFLEVKPFYHVDVYTENGNGKVKNGVKRGEMWIYFSELLIFIPPPSPLFIGSYFGLQIGRQNFNEKREWWWDEDLDAVRIYSKIGPWHLEVTMAEEIARISTDKEYIDPEAENVLRVLCRAKWRWDKKQRVELFFLYNYDHSKTESKGDIVNKDQRDKSDADLVWIGARAIGRWKFRPFGRLYYWLDTAMVWGEEKLIDFDDLDGERRIVGSIERRDVYGLAVDAGITWKTRWPWQPSLTLGYAMGSGDHDLKDGTDWSFRQTGLQDNNGKFRGVDRFKYYGELLRPELSNLHILTTSLGLRFLQNSSVEFLYHWYWQVHAAPFLRDARIKTDPRGQDTTIGQELDVVIGIEEWKHFEIELVSAVFSAGDAFGPDSGEIASNVIFKLNYNF